MPQNYERTIPDAPLPISMLPRAEQLTLQDLFLLTQPGNPQGHRSKALTLQMLAAFLANTNLQEITLAGPNGKTFVLNGEGSTYTKPPTAGTLDRFTITENDDGIKVAVTGPQVSRVVKMATNEISISRTQGGLESKVTLTESGIEVSYQTRVDGQVVTITSTLNSGELDISLLKVLGVNDNDWNFKVWKDSASPSGDYGTGDLMVGENMGNFIFHIYSKFSVWRKAYFDKDVDINANVTIEKSLKLDGVNATLENKMGATNIKSLYFQTQQRSEYQDTLIYCSNLTISEGSYTLPNLGSAAENKGLFKIVANDTNSSVQVYFRGSLNVTLAPGQAAQFLWNGGDIGWFRF